MTSKNSDKPVNGKLVSYVHVADERGTFAAFGPDDEVPEWAARKMGAHCFEGGVHPLADEKESPSDTPPPKAGAGSSKEAWASYAAGKGVEVEDGASRDQILEALDAAGVPTE
jgi:hypothetical protein